MMIKEERIVAYHCDVCRGISEQHNPDPDRDSFPLGWSKTHIWRVHDNSDLTNFDVTGPGRAYSPITLKHEWHLCNDCTSALITRLEHKEL